MLYHTTLLISRVDPLTNTCLRNPSCRIAFDDDIYTWLNTTSSNNSNFTKSKLHRSHSRNIVEDYKTMADFFPNESVPNIEAGEYPSSRMYLDEIVNLHGSEIGLC